VASFHYKAVDSGGSIFSGELLASSRPAALDELARRGLLPFEVQEGPATAPGRPPPFSFDIAVSRWLGAVRSRRRPLGRRQLLRLTDSLAALLGAGLTLERTLRLCAQLAEPAGRTLAASLLAAIQAGQTLSAAFRAEIPRSLPPYFVSMLEAGEAGGSLPQTLGQLVELVRRQLTVQERVRSALFYPCILAAVMLLTLVMLLTFVLPRFEGLFAQAEVPLPWSTRAVLALGRFVADEGWLVGGALAGTGVLAGLWLHTPRGGERFDRWVLRTPLTFGLPVALSTARFLRTLSTLCRNGLPLAAGLRIARGTLVNRALLTASQEVLQAVQAGDPLSAALHRTGLFPAVAVQLARVGEETGRLEDLLLSAASVLEEDSQLRLERLLALLVPSATLVMGALVAGLISSVLIGLLSINDLAF
jgi:general secretion pathway protein F